MEMNSELALSFLKANLLGIFTIVYCKYVCKRPSPEEQMHYPNTDLQAILSAYISFILCFHIFTSEPNQAQKYSFIYEASEAPSLITHYDYIVIGGGTAGCPLATTLSQTSKVLVLERGGSPYTNKNINTISGILDVILDLSPTSPSQQFISEEGVSNVRAKVLGGGTCINRGFYSRASRDYVKRAGWDERLVNRSYEWVEESLVHKPSTLLQWQLAMRDALLEAGVSPYNGFTYDHLIGTKIGGTIFDRRGKRHTAADLFEHANPEGITVLLHATAQRILFKQVGEGRPRASGIIFKDSTGAAHAAYLNKGLINEIIVCAGALGSPQLLMLSGIGPKDHLQSLGIELVMDQPSVGQAIQDNPKIQILIPSPLPVEVLGGQIVSITNNSRSYIFLTNSGNKAGRITAKVAKPLSTGHLKLIDTNPDRNPSVTFNYFSRAEDVLTCAEHLKIIERVINSATFSKFRYSEITFESLLDLTADFMDLRRHHNYSMQTLGQFCKDTVTTIWHYHGGCEVGRVVDNDYRVIDVDALRVLDGSTFDESPGTNPQATLMMLGRYMGIKIQEERITGDEGAIR